MIHTELLELANYGGLTAQQITKSFAGPAGHMQVALYMRSLHAELSKKGKKEKMENKKKKTSK